jgi:hypothetical protein
MKLGNKKSETLSMDELATLICTELLTNHEYVTQRCPYTDRIPYLKASYAERMRLSRKIVDNIL